MLLQTDSVGPGRLRQIMHIREGHPFIDGVIIPSSGRNLILLFKIKHKFLSIQLDNVALCVCVGVIQKVTVSDLTDKLNRRFRQESNNG